MTNIELVNKLKNIATNYKTLYVMGCFGAPMNATNKARYCKNTAYNKQAARTQMINAATPDTFGFDCVCLIKGVLWGWNGDKNKTYGGASYASNGVPDIGTESFIAACKNVTTDFSKIEVGECLWMEGHVGVYIGDGLAVECSPSWANRVQITAVKNIGTKSGYNARKWTKHGKIPYITYEQTKPTTNTNEVVYTVVKGDTLSSIAKKYGTTYKVLAEYNGISNPNVINVGQKIKIPTAATTTPKKSNEQIAKEVIQGKWGNGAARKKALEAAGYVYSTIQNLVNKLLK